MSLLLEFHSDKIELHTPTSTSQQFQSAYFFCKEWLSGQQRFLVKTSGSTGNPKSILLTRGQLEVSARNLGNYIGYQPHDEMHVVINANSIGGLMQIVRAMCYHMNVYVYEPSVDVVESIAIEEGKRAHISLVSPMLDYVVKSNKKLLNSFTTILVGGSKLGEMDFSGINAHIYETYGMTETASNVALKDLNKGETTFKLLPHWNLKLHNDNCLALFHPAITFDWINTNDMVAFEEDMSFKILGRSDFVINSGWDRPLSARW
ncbi:MAG: AMP-binding protein [Bacteroidetes bacterium]|nr:AMP-binding protein [Bacteroidota bacterium]